MMQYDKAVFQYDQIVQKASETYGVPTEWIRAIMQAESSGNPNDVSPKGATGLMQLMPETAKELGVTDIRDPYQNVMAGTAYFKQMLDRFGDPKLALAAYNAGPGRVNAYLAGKASLPEETRNYVNKLSPIVGGQASFVAPTQKTNQTQSPLLGNISSYAPIDISGLTNMPQQRTMSPVATEPFANGLFDSPFSQAARYAGQNTTNQTQAMPNRQQSHTSLPRPTDISGMFYEAVEPFQDVGFSWGPFSGLGNLPKLG